MLSNPHATKGAIAVAREELLFQLFSEMKLTWLARPSSNRSNPVCRKYVRLDFRQISPADG